MKLIFSILLTIGLTISVLPIFAESNQTAIENENLGKKIDTLIENVTKFDYSINLISGNISELDESVELVSGNISELDESVELVSGNISELDESVELVSGNISELDESVDELIGELGKKSSQYNEFQCCEPIIIKNDGKYGDERWIDLLISIIGPVLAVLGTLFA